MAASKPALNGAAESWAGAANWKDLDESVVDPITLEPIADLAVAPFRLKGFLFDAEALACYLVASSRYENPLDRSALTARECAALDGHLAAHGLRAMRVAQERVAAEKRKAKAASEAEARAAEAEERRAAAARQTAADLLDALFATRRPNSARRAPARGRRSPAPDATRRRRGGGMVMIDDDELPPDVLRDAETRDDADFWREEAAEAFPALPAAPPRPAAPAATWGRPAPPSAAPSRDDARAFPEWESTIRETKARDAAAQERKRAARAAAREADDAAKVAAAQALLAEDHTPDGDAILRKAAVVERLGADFRRRRKIEDARALWSEDLLAWARSDPRRVRAVEYELEALLKSRQSSRCLRPMRREFRKKAHAVCERYNCHTISYERSPERYVRILKAPRPAAPDLAPSTPAVALSEAAALVPAPPRPPPPPPKPPKPARAKREKPPPPPPPPPEPTEAERRAADEEAQLAEAIRRSMLPDPPRAEPPAPAGDALPSYDEYVGVAPAPAALPTVADLLAVVGLERLADVFAMEEVRDLPAVAGLTDDEFRELGVEEAWAMAALRDSAAAAIR